MTGRGGLTRGSECGTTAASAAPDRIGTRLPPLSHRMHRPVRQLSAPSEYLQSQRLLLLPPRRLSPPGIAVTRCAGQLLESVQSSAVLTALTMRDGPLACSGSTARRLGAAENTCNGSTTHIFIGKHSALTAALNVTTVAPAVVIADGNSCEGHTARFQFRHSASQIIGIHAQPDNGHTRTNKMSTRPFCSYSCLSCVAAHTAVHTPEDPCCTTWCEWFAVHLQR